MNKEIERFNSLLSSFRSDVEIFIQNNSDKEASNLKELVKDFVTKNYFAHRINTKTKVKKYTIPENMFDLINHYIDYRSVADVTKGVKPLAENTIKKYKTLQNILMDEYKKIPLYRLSFYKGDDFKLMARFNISCQMPYHGNEGLKLVMPS